MWVPIVAALSLTTGFSSPSCPQVERHLTGWVLATAVVLLAVVALAAFPYNGGVLEASSTEVGGSQEQHRDGIRVLGFSALVAAAVLGTKGIQLRVRRVPFGWLEIGSIIGVVLLLGTGLFLLVASVWLHPDSWP